MRLLLDRGACASAYGDDALILASEMRGGHPDVVRLLLDRGADARSVLLNKNSYWTGGVLTVAYVLVVSWLKRLFHMMIRCWPVIAAFDGDKRVRGRDTRMFRERKRQK